MFKLSIDKDKRRQRQGKSMLKTELRGSPDTSLCIKRGMLQYQFSSEILALQHPYIHAWNIDLWLSKANELSSTIESIRKYFSYMLYKRWERFTHLLGLVCVVSRIFSADGPLTPKLFIMSEGFVRTFHISNSMVLKMWKGRSISNSLSICCGYCNCIYGYCIL